MSAQSIMDFNVRVADEALDEPIDGEVFLRGCGNPDYAQYADVSPIATVKVGSLREASKTCRSYIQGWNLGGGNWAGGEVSVNGEVVAWVSYNGRVWKRG